MLPEHLVVKQEHHRKNHAEPCHQLTDAQVGPRHIQAVGAKALNKDPAQAVPAQIHHENLPVIFSPFGDKMENQQAQGVPQRFIEKGGMYINRGPGGIRQAHAEEIVR